MPLREHYDYRKPEEETGAMTAVDEPMSGVMSHVQTVHPPPNGECSAGPHQPRRWRDKAPPVDLFTSEDPETHLDDWLPALRRAGSWNDWSEEELLIQLAGHLRGRALQEWTLMDPSDRPNFETAIKSL